MLGFAQIVSIAANHDDAISYEGLQQLQLVHCDIELVFDVEADLRMPVTQESISRR